MAPVKIGYENTYLYLTRCPFTGAGFAAFLPKLTSHFFGWFVKQVEAYLPGKSLFIADGATAHKAALFDNLRPAYRSNRLECVPGFAPGHRAEIDVGG